jgi:hypothetical protein
MMQKVNQLIINLKFQLNDEMVKKKKSKIEVKKKVSYMNSE